MLLALAGVTGVGKSYFKDKIVEKLGFEKIKIITTREIRVGEKNNEDKIFVTPTELEDEGYIDYSTPKTQGMNRPVSSRRRRR